MSEQKHDEAIDNDDLTEMAWGIIANASDWDDETRQEWVDAAVRWRDAYFTTLPKANARLHELKERGV